MVVRIFDIETYPNLFVFTAKNPGTKDYDIFVIFEDDKGDDHIDESKLLYEYLKKQDKMYFGYNNMRFDAPIIEHLYKKKGKVTAGELFELAQGIISREVRAIPHWEFKTKQIDLYTIWGYDNSARRTSLKWLEFTMREKKIKDLPYHFTKTITKRQVDEVVKYCKYDVDKTESLFDKSASHLELRKAVYEKYKKFDFLSKSDTSLGSDTFLIDLAEDMRMRPSQVNKMRTFYDKLALKDCIIYDRISSISAEPFKEVIQDYGTRIIDKHDPAHDENVLILKGAVTKEVDFDGITFKYGTGGLHASVSNKLFIADEDHLIVDVDVASFYPNLAIVNKLHPKHLSSSFIKLYKNLYDERKQIPKSNPWNKAKKLSLNSIFGKSNSAYSYLYDPAFTLGITLNGQLQLSMLAEQLARCSSLIQVNTDGVTVMVHKSQLDLINKVCRWWEQKTNLVLESAEYKQMAILDVNNYHAIFIGDDLKVKRKGRLGIYGDYEENQEWHKNPSATIIAEAVNNNLVNGVPVGDTIYNCDDIFDFLIGFKKKSNFEFLIAEADENGYVNLKTNSDRVIRYYVSDKGQSIYKLTNKQGLTTLAKNLTLRTAQIIGRTSLDRYPDLNLEWYVNEAQTILDSFELVDNAEFVSGKFVKLN